MYARERAEALLALGEVERALPYAVASCDLHPRVSGRLRGLLFDWAGHPESANKTVEAAEKRSDAAPDRIELARSAAEHEPGRAGRERQAEAELEAVAAAQGMRGHGASVTRAGASLRAVRRGDSVGMQRLVRTRPSVRPARDGVPGPG